MNDPFAPFGIPIGSLQKKEVLEHIDEALSGERFFRVATVNPEFLLEAQGDRRFFENLLSADLRVVDGFGIVVAGWLRGKVLHRYPGADLLGRIFEKAEREGLGVFIAARKDGLSSYEEIKNALLNKYPELVIGGAEFDLHQAPICTIPNTRYRILLCNFGAPQQEFFVESCRGHAEGIRLALGIGGACDFLTGKRKRAPKWLRAMGCEWLWRLLVQPEKIRLARVWRATGVFLWKTLFSDRKCGCRGKM